MRQTVRSAAGVALAACLALAVANCGGGSDGDESAETPGGPAAFGADGVPPASDEDPPTAQRFRVDMLRHGRDAPRHSSDGGGKAWLEDPVDAVASRPGTWTILYEAGPEGVAVGGIVRLTIPPFWHWSDPQDQMPTAPGYTTASCEAEGVALESFVPDRGVFQVRIAGRALREGERIRFVYGAGRGKARADQFVERESPFWIMVDGDGDGVVKAVPDTPTINVLPGPPAQIVLTAPSTAHPGDEVELHVAVLDRAGNRGVAFEGVVDFPGVPEGVVVPERVELTIEDGGVKTVAMRVAEAGVVRLLGRAMPADAPEDFEGMLGESNPLVVDERAPRILWGDLHGHSNLSDGTGTPEDYFAYARDVAALDVSVLTDHDHWGMLKIDANPEMWERLNAAVRDHHEPGRFVTLFGYEWTSWIHGHRHVLYFDEGGAVFSSLDASHESPLQLWDALREQGVPAMTFAHHSAGGPIATNWDIPPDPEFEPITEVMSVHGSSEARDSPALIYSPLPGNFVRDALDRGYRFGFVGSGDSHDGHPGLVHLASPHGGLAAILSEENTRDAVLEALRQRRCYATSGPRILLRTALDGHRMGSTIAAPSGDEPAFLYVHVTGTAPINAVQVIRSGAIAQTIDCEGAWQYSVGLDLPELSAGEYVYVRVVQADRGLAWSSPFFVE